MSHGRHDTQDNIIVATLVSVTIKGRETNKFLQELIQVKVHGMLDFLVSNDNDVAVIKSEMNS